MTRPTLTYKTADGREFESESKANHHANLLVHIDQFMDRQGVGETRRNRLRQMLIDWKEKVENTDFDRVPAEDGA